MELTKWMGQYRECVREVWNNYFAGSAGWDELCLFLDADVALFRGIVLARVGEFDRYILPSYRGDRQSVDSISVTILDVKGVHVLFEDGTLKEIGDLVPIPDVRKWQLKFFSLHDFYELGPRDFEYVRCAVSSLGPDESLVPKSVFAPFAQVEFLHHRLPPDESPPQMRIPGYWVP